MKEDQIYECNSCGAKLYTQKHKVIEKCPFCGSYYFSQANIEKNYVPKKMITFKTTKEEAIANIENFFDELLFLPDDFKSNLKLNEIEGIYLPMFLVSGKRKYKSLIKKKDNFEYYEYYDEGINYPIDGSRYTDDEMIKSIEPFNYEDLKEFNPAYLLGFSAQVYDLTKEEFNALVLTKFGNMIQRTTGEAGEVRIKNLTTSYIFVPIWTMTYEYKGKKYRIMVNGQTGKVNGEAPYDKKKMYTPKIIFLSILPILVFISAFIFPVMLLVGLILLAVVQEIIKKEWGGEKFLSRKYKEEISSGYMSLKEKFNKINKIEFEKEETFNDITLDEKYFKTYYKIEEIIKSKRLNEIKYKRVEGGEIIALISIEFFIFALIYSILLIGLSK